MKKSLSRKYLFFTKFLLFEPFFWREIFLNFFVQKLSFEISVKKRNFSKKTKTKISLFTCVEERIHTWRLSSPLLRLVTLLSESNLVCIQLSLISAGDIRCIKPTLSFFPVFFFQKKKSFCFPIVFFSDFFASIVLQFFHGTTSLFTLFISFFYLVSCPFFLSSCFVKGIWWQRTKHVIKRNEWKQRWEWSPRSEKRRSLLLACFWAWLKVWVDGPASTKENASADYFWQGLAAIVCFLWFTALCATQTARRTPASEGLSSSPYVLSLSTFVLLMLIQDGTREAEKLILEDSTVCVEDQRKIVEKQLPTHVLRHHRQMETVSRLVLTNQCPVCLAVYGDRKAAHRHLLSSLRRGSCRDRSRYLGQVHIPQSLCCPVCSAEPGNWSELQSHLAEHLSSVFNGFRNAGLGETQVGGGSAKPGSASGETGGGRRGQRTRGSATTGGRADYSVSGQRGRTERPDLHSVQDIPGPKLGKRGRSNGRGRSALPRLRWRNQEQARSRARRRSRATRSPFRVRVGSVPAQLGLDEGVGSRTRGSSETVLGEQRVEERASAVGVARPVLQSEAVQESRGQGRVDAHRVLPGSDHLPTRGSTGGSIAAAERGEEIRPRAKRPPRTRSSEALDADAREIERLARRVEQHSQRMAELLRRGVLEPSLAYAFLMTKGGQRIPQAKSKAKARASSLATTSEGAEAAPDKSPPRLPPERPLMVFTRGEMMVPSNAGPEVRTSDWAWRLIFRWTLLHGPCARTTEFLLLDTVARLLYKDGVTLDIAAWAPAQEWQSRSEMGSFFLKDTEVWLAQGWHAQIRVVFSLWRTHGSLIKDDTHKSSCWKFEREESMAPAQRRQFVIRKRLAWPMRKATHNFEYEWLCLHPAQCLKEQRWSTVAASVVSTGAIGPSVHPPDEAPAGLSLSSQRVRLMLITSTQGSVSRSCWVVFFFWLSLPDRNLETSVRIHFHFHYVLSLSTFVLLMLIQDGTREAEKLNLEDSTVCVEDQRKIVEKQLHGAALVNYEEYMRDHHDRLKLLSNKAWAKNWHNDTEGRNLPNHWGEWDAPLQSFGAGQDSLKEDGGVVNTRWWSVEMMEEHGWRNGHEKRMNENCGRDETVVWWVGLFILHMVLLKDVQKLSWYHRFSSLLCVIQRQVSQFRVFRNCGSYAKCRKSTRWSMSLSWCIGFSPLFRTRKRKPQSFRELCEEPDRMFSKNCVVWTSTWA